MPFQKLFNRIRLYFKRYNVADVLELAIGKGYYNDHHHRPHLVSIRGSNFMCNAVKELHYDGLISYQQKWATLHYINDVLLAPKAGVNYCYLYQLVMGEFGTSDEMRRFVTTHGISFYKARILEMRGEKETDL